VRGDAVGLLGDGDASEEREPGRHQGAQDADAERTAQGGSRPLPDHQEEPETHRGPGESGPLDEKAR
jgi:hypothetical protein